MEYTIMVPSRARAETMPALREILPSAIICVDEREADDYRRTVPAENLVLHPSSTGAPAARNWMIDYCKTPCLVQCDDDLKGVQVNVGSRRYIREPDEILAIIENAVTACSDLGLGVFCFSRTSNTTIIRPDERPVVPVQQVYGIWGMMNKARYRRYDETLKSRADLDFTMQTFLADRCVYADVRFYFDFGSSFSGSGGNSGLVTPKDFEESTRKVARRWGKAISFKRPAWMKSGDTVAGKPAVRRQNSLAKR